MNPIDALFLDAVLLWPARPRQMPEFLWRMLWAWRLLAAIVFCVLIGTIGIVLIAPDVVPVRRVIVIFAVAAMAKLVCVIGAAKRIRRECQRVASEGLWVCPRCGYILRDASCCSECGARYSHSNLHDFWRRFFTRSGVHLGS